MPNVLDALQPTVARLLRETFAMQTFVPGCSASLDQPRNYSDRCRDSFKYFPLDASLVRCIIFDFGFLLPRSAHTSGVSGHLTEVR